MYLVLQKNDVYSLHKKKISKFTFIDLLKSYNFLRIAVTLILLHCSLLFF